MSGYKYPSSLPGIFRSGQGVICIILLPLLINPLTPCSLWSETLQCAGGGQLITYQRAHTPPCQGCPPGDPSSSAALDITVPGKYQPHHLQVPLLSGSVLLCHCQDVKSCASGYGKMPSCLLENAMLLVFTRGAHIHVVPSRGAIVPNSWA